MKRWVFISLATGALFAVGFLFANDEEEIPMETLTVELPNFEGMVGWNEQIAGSPNAGTLIGIHGTPGSWTAWLGLMSEPLIKEQYNFYAFDRPGWGVSRDNENQVLPKLEDQVSILSETLDQMELTPPKILVAHSWGGPVALALAAARPDLVDAVVVIASPADPSVSEPRWYHKAAKLKLIQFIIGRSMSRSNVEMLTLDEELKWLAPQLAQITQPVAIMQGKKDWLVKPENAFYLERMLENATVNLLYDEKANHFIPFRQTELVANTVDWAASQLSVASAANCTEQC